MNFDFIRELIAIVLLMLVVLFAISRFIKKRVVFTPALIAKCGVFSTLAIILYCVPVFAIKLPFFPSFLDLHFDEVPVLICGFAYGPLAGTVVLLLKTIVKLPFTSTACAGELADFIFSLGFIFPASIIYRKHRTFKGALISLLVGSFVQIVTASTLTTLVMLDVYSFLYQIPKEVILEMCKAINPLVNELNWKFALMVSVPFNALKDALVVVLVLILYKKLKGLIDRISTKKTSIKYR